MVRSFLGSLPFMIACALLGGCSGENSPNPMADESEKSVSTFPFVGNPPAIFSEVSTINLSYEDHEGGDAAWVEFFNPSDTAVSMAGFSLTDSMDEPRKWIFGNAVVPPKSFMLVFLSGKNYPDYEMPHDSLNMIGSGCWTWTDSQNDVAGYSFAEPLEGKSKICYSEDRARHVGADMQFGDNKELGWNSISVFVGTGNSNKEDVVDISMANELLLTGFITKDRQLSLRLAQPDLDDWKGYEIVFTGTGDSNTTYRAALPTGSRFPDLAHIYGTRFSPQSLEVLRMQMNVKSYVVRNRGHEPHTSFKVKKKAGSLYLVNEACAIVDSVAYPEMPIGKSWTLGTSAEGVNAWGFAAESPYGFASEIVVPEQSPKPVHQMPVSGFYAAPFDVVFDASEYVRCENGGAPPNENSVPITALRVDSTMTVRCASFVPGKLPSGVITRTYVFESQPGIATVFVTGNPLSLFDPDTGLYTEGSNAQETEPHYGANYWSDREVPVFVELLEPGKQELGFAENAGLKIFGNYSRMNDKKSVVITFREKYGKKRLDYPLFPEFPLLTKFKNFVLRNNGSNYSADYIHDRLASSISEGLGVDYQRGRPSIVFYNGEYFGIHNIRERATEYYFETHYGMDPSDIDLLKADNSVTNGSSTDYVALMDWLEDHHLDVEENYKYLSERIDVNNFLNYVHTEIFVNNRDWPGNNLKKWRSHNPETKWKWFLYDLDFGFGNNYSEYTNNIFEFATAEDGESWPNGPEYTLLLRRLLENEYFRESFVNRMMVLLATNFESGRILSRIEKMMAEIEPEIARDQKRWKHSRQYMETTLSKMKNFAKTRQEEIVTEMENYFSLTEKFPLTISVSGSGVVLVNELPLNAVSVTVNFYAIVPVTLTAQESAGSVFVGWSDGLKDRIRVIMPSEITNITAIFR